MKKELLKNKIYAVFLVLFGILMTILLEGDATFLIFAAIVAVYLIITDEPFILD